MQVGDLPKDGPAVLAAVEGISGAQQEGSHVIVPARQRKDVLVWKQDELIEKIAVNKHGGQDEKIESIGSSTKSVPWAVGDSSGTLHVDRSMPPPPLESILHQRRDLLSAREVERLSTYKRVTVPRTSGGDGSQRREIRTETAVARRFRDSVLTAGTLLTVIGSVRYDRARGMTVYAAGDLSYIGRQDIQTLIANAYGSADSSNWIAKAAMTVGGAAVLWGLYRRYCSAQQRNTVASQLPAPAAVPGTGGSSSAEESSPPPGADDPL